MKVAITGAYGFLGYHLTNYYLNQDYQVFKLGRDYLEQLHTIKDCDFLIHCAGVNRAETDEMVYQGNVSLAEGLVSKLKELDIKIPIKFISSIQETNNSVYGNSKLKSKEILNQYCIENNTKFESYALPNLYGTHGKPYYNSFVNTFAYNISQNIPCSHNSNSISLCWVEDAIQVIDNKTSTYSLETTTVEEVYNVLNNIKMNLNLSPTTLTHRLKKVFNYYQNRNKNIMVLGHTGMLGSMVVSYLKSQGYQITTTINRYPSKEFKQEIKNFKGDFIINCIGAIPQRTKDFSINTDLPIFLSKNSPCRVIHPGTDCEIDNDDYGISKKKASDFILNSSKNTKILQTSIIGPEKNTSYGLMAWFLAQEGEVQGYTQAIWNGNTTLEWAKQCQNLIEKWEQYNMLTILEGEPISKYEMLNLFKIFYNKEITIIPKDLGKDKCLKGHIKTKPLKQQLKEMKIFVDLEWK